MISTPAQIILFTRHYRSRWWPVLCGGCRNGGVYPSFMLSSQVTWSFSMWSWSTNVTDGRTDRQTDDMQSQYRALHYSAFLSQISLSRACQEDVAASTSVRHAGVVSCQIRPTAKFVPVAAVRMRASPNLVLSWCCVVVCEIWRTVVSTLLTLSSSSSSSFIDTP